MILVLIWSVVLITIVVIYFHRIYSKFSDNEVNHFATMPFFGNMTKTIFRVIPMAYYLERLYNEFPNERFVGLYEFVKPILIVKDIELVKKIAIKDFEHFLDHRSFTDEKVEPLFARNLFSLQGQEWKDMRSTLSPAFTSSKIKLMIPFMEDVGEQMVQSLKKEISDSANGVVDVNCKDLTSRYANDVIASCAFGLRVDSHADKTNHFYEMGKEAATFKFRKLILFFTLSACPAISKRLKVTLFSRECKTFFKNLVLNTMKDRETKNIIRPDMIHLLMEAKKGQLYHEDNINPEAERDTGFATVEESAVGRKVHNRVWSDNDLVAQALLFFLAGFQTASTAMSFTLYELALHPDIQDRLYNEIKEHNDKHNGKLSFSTIQEMTYMDMVVSEALRMWPPITILDRICVRDYNLGKPNKKATKDYIIRKDDCLSIPVWCFHRDPQFYSEPMKFDPERFSDENRHLINPMAYMPFGLGPRNCVGSRFALCELKFLLYHILLHHEIFPSEKTCVPAKLSTESFNPRLKGGFWLKFKLRV